MEFSERTSWNLEENELAAALRARRAAGNPLLDLTMSNPANCGFVYDEALMAALAHPEAIRYQPDPLGMLRAREAVAQYYRDGGAEVETERICLTTSTSEAYSFLFRLLCNPGDEVLIARPSYPLFEFIARLDDVVLREYPLLYDPNGGGWAIDLHSMEAMMTAKTKAVIVVHPNNPTGNFASKLEKAELERICAVRGVALIVDEVFLDYAIRGCSEPSFGVGSSQCLRFVLSGISKVCGLPQMKASWLVACGPEAMAAAAMERIEVIADTFLSMNAPVQFALPVWLTERPAIQRQIRERCSANLAALDERLAGSPCERLVMQAGWTAVVRVPRLGVDFALAALERGVVVQPGEFYGLPSSRIVVSLLTPQAIWLRGLELLPV